MWDHYGPSFFCEEGVEFVSNSQKKRFFLSDRLATNLSRIHDESTGLQGSKLL